MREAWRICWCSEQRGHTVRFGVIDIIVAYVDVYVGGSGGKDVGEVEEVSLRSSGVYNPKSIGSRRTSSLHLASLLCNNDEPPAEPMRAQGNATRRFYNAFYHWTLLVEPPHSSARAFTRTTRQLVNGRDSIRCTQPAHPFLPTAKKDGHVVRQHGRVWRAAAFGTCKQRRDQALARAHDARPVQSIVHDKVQRPQERLFSSTQAWDEAVREETLFARERQEGKEDAVKMILRPMAHPVVVVIAATRNADTSSETIDHFRGVTVSSLSSVTVAPKAILSFNLRLPSRTWDAIQSNAKISISLLEASTEGAAIAHAFTKPHEDPAEAFRELSRLGYGMRSLPFADIKRLCKVHPSGETDIESAIFGWFVAEVKLDSCVKIGDHVIVVAEVLHTLLLDKARERAAAGESFGLVYANREYKQPGSTIQPMPIPGQEPPPTTRASASSPAPANPQPSINSSVSFLKQIWRGYSTSAKSPTPNPSQIKAASNAERDSLETQISDKSLLSNTAREFLNSHDEDPYVPRRMRAMLKAKKEAYKASRDLERALADGTLTAEESERLENIITRNERWLAKKLAFNSAYDLRLMLDKGKVDVARAQWLESSIEKGQAVLLEEIRQIRALYDGGKLDEARYKTAKDDLEKDNQILATEAMRLRQMVDEETDNGGAEPEGKAFDGFKGNL